MDILKKITDKQYLYALIIWTVIIFVLLLIPSSSFARSPKLINIPHADKIAHFTLFAAESFFVFAVCTLKGIRPKPNLYVFITVLIAVLGLITEILQGLMYNTAKRNFSLADLAFDILSCITVMVVLYFIKDRIFPEKKNIKEDKL